MKSPKIPSATKSVNPTAPQVNASGMLNEITENRKKKGLFSTLLGGNTPAGNRLRTYLDSSTDTTTVYGSNNNPNTRNRSGVTVKS